MNFDRLALWSGPGFLVLFGLGFAVCAGFMPAPSPELDATMVSALFQDRISGVRLGVVLMWFAAALMIPWTGLISVQLKRIPGVSLTLVYAQLAAGAIGVVLLVVISTLWGIAAFRPERDPALTQLINDAAWLLLIAPVPTAAMQPAVIGMAILGDRSNSPLFPRWSGWANLWIAVSFIPGFAALFFKHGPFAWSGLLPYWIPVGTFGGWFILMFAVLRQALPQPGSSEGV